MPEPPESSIYRFPESSDWSEVVYFGRFRSQRFATHLADELISHQYFLFVDRPVFFAMKYFPFQNNLLMCVRVARQL
jgi:hypothetical protein